MGKLTQKAILATQKCFWPLYIQNARFFQIPPLPNFQKKYGDWGCIFTYYAFNASTGQFIFDFDPFRVSVLRCFRNYFVFVSKSFWETWAFL